MALPLSNYITVDDYLVFESNARHKHEFYDGFLIAMAGASQRHRDIQTNVITTLSNQFRTKQKPCKVHGSDARIAVSATRYFYPDVVIFCDKILENKHGCALNPRAVIEILSDSTEKFDVNEKSRAYKENSHITEILLIDSRVPEITLLRRDELVWREEQYSKGNDQMQFCGADLTMKEIYFGVTFNQ